MPSRSDHRFLLLDPPGLALLQLSLRKAQLRQMGVDVKGGLLPGQNQDVHPQLCAFASLPRTGRTMVYQISAESPIDLGALLKALASRGRDVQAACDRW
ncbi:MAG: hypothetical protein JWO95_1330 [Verrucomicrobiales bacterium]|nr:hypothetical protein [Verrucomicrobiales bacterium]